MKAFRAYGPNLAQELSMLSLAVNVWNLVNGYVIQPSDAKNETHPKKTAKISSMCNGGLLWFSRISLSPRFQHIIQHLLLEAFSLCVHVLASYLFITKFRSMRIILLAPTSMEKLLGTCSLLSIASPANCFAL